MYATFTVDRTLCYGVSLDIVLLWSHPSRGRRPRHRGGEAPGQGGLGALLRLLQEPGAARLPAARPAGHRHAQRLLWQER